MFFNISNHPCNVEKSTWSKEQIEVANMIGGEVVDIPFPTITPDMTNDRIAAIAKEVARDVAGMAGASSMAGAPISVAMVAGEYVATIMIISELQKYDIDCYFGQSERIAEEREENGQVVVVHKFQFVNFRKCPEIVVFDKE